MSSVTHYEGCWRDPKHHACAVREIERLRTDHELLSDDYKQLLKDNERLRHKNDALRNGLEGADRLSNAFAETACRRGARMQIMLEWLSDSEIQNSLLWKEFLMCHPEAAEWFDVDGVPR